MDAAGHAYDNSRSADTIYGRRPWTDAPRWSYTGPFASNEERLVQQALASMDLPGEELQEFVRPPLPQIDAFPARFGYDRRAIGINDVINMGRTFPAQSRVSWFSGGVGGYTGSSRNTLGNGV